MGSTPIVSKILIGRELRHLREKAGLSQADAAKHLVVNPTKITKVEVGRQALTVAEVKELLRLYEYPEAAWAPVLQLARDALRRTSHRVADFAKKFVGLEEASSEIRMYEAEIVPGLFQTEDYARAITLAADPQRPPELVDQYVSSRMTRREVLTRETPPHVWAVINEGALRRLVGGADVMKRQLEDLLEIAQLPTVAIHVLPYSAGAHAAMGSCFILLRLPESLDVQVVYLEDLSSSDYLDQVPDVRRYSLVFDRLVSASLDAGRSEQIINQIRNEL